MTQERAETGNSSKTESFLSAFPDLIVDVSEVGQTFLPETEEEEIFYLFGSNEKVFDLYVVAKDWLTENFTLDTTVVSTMLKEAELSYIENWRKLAFIHSGYMEITWPRIKAQMENSNG